MFLRKLVPAAVLAGALLAGVTVAAPTAMAAPVADAPAAAARDVSFTNFYATAELCYAAGSLLPPNVIWVCIPYGYHWMLYGVQIGG